MDDKYLQCENKSIVSSNAQAYLSSLATAQARKKKREVEGHLRMCSVD